MSEKNKKKKKEKIVYIDDGRTISDMSGTSKGMFIPSRKKKEPKATSLGQTPLQTYWGAVKMMFVPMLVVIGLISLVFLLMYFSMK